MSSKKVSQKSVQTVSARQWIRLIVLYFSIPLVLLVCCGDFGWWQAWLYSLLLFAAGIVGRIWVEQRHPGLLAERQSIENIKSAKAWDKVLAPLMALIITVIRTVLEDQTLQEELHGYQEYTRRVRYLLIQGIY